MRHMERGRLLIAVVLTLGLMMVQSAGPVHASAGQVADCTFSTLQSDLQAGGDWYYASGQCASNTPANTITFTSTITISSNASLTSNGADIVLSGNSLVRH